MDIVEFQPVVVYRPSRIHWMFWSNCRCSLWMWSVFDCLFILSYLLVQTSNCTSVSKELSFLFEDSEYLCSIIV